MRSAFLLVTCVALVATPATDAQAPRRDASVPFDVGETLTFDVTYSQFLVAGTAVSRVVERQTTTGRSSYHISVEGRPIELLERLYKLYYRMDTLLDTATLLPHSARLYSEEGTRRRTSTTTFDRAGNRAFLEVETETKAALAFDVPPQVQDGLSALYIFRTMSVNPGDTYTLPVVDEGTLYEVSASVGPAEPVKVAVWVSTDSRRLPLKLQADLTVGSFVLVLRSATP
jgi:hypothetical protein